MNPRLLWLALAIGGCTSSPPTAHLANPADARARRNEAEAFEAGQRYRDAVVAWEAYVALDLAPSEHADGARRLAAAREAFAQHYDIVELPSATDDRVPPELELAWAREWAADALRDAPRLSESLVTSYIDGLARTLVAHAKGMSGEIETLVLDSPVVNAQAGLGLVIVYRGLLDVVEQENELAAAIAHEIGHAAAHHAGRAYLRALRADPSLLDPGATRLDRPVDVGYTAEDEAQADRLAIHITFDAGYDPMGLVELFRRFLRRVPESRRHWEYLATTHPITAARIETATKYCALLPRRQLIVTTPEFTKITQRLRSLSSTTR